MTTEQSPQEEQLGLALGETAPRASADCDPDEVREDMMELLSEARAMTAASLWDARTLRFNKLIFPQMARWLPDDEAEQLCFDFKVELERIEALLAA